jgi:hypothetical protein
VIARLALDMPVFEQRIGTIENTWSFVVVVWVVDKKWWALSSDWLRNIRSAQDRCGSHDVVLVVVVVVVVVVVGSSRSVQ